MEKKTKETIPFWLAVVITALLPLPLGMFMGNWNVPLWCSFIVWAQYFVYGGNPGAFKKILGPFAAGALFSTAGMFLSALLGQGGHGLQYAVGPCVPGMLVGLLQRYGDDARCLLHRQLPQCSGGRTSRSPPHRGCLGNCVWLVRLGFWLVQRYNNVPPRGCLSP